MTALPDIRDSASQLIDSMRQDAERAIGSVERTLTAPDGQGPVERVVGGFYHLLATTGARVNTMWAAINIQAAREQQATGAVTPATAERIAKARILLIYWTALAQGFATYVREADASERGRAVKVGVAPAAVVIAVAGIAAVMVIAVSITGVAWAIVHYAQAQNLERELDLLERDPGMADALARINEGGGAGPGGKGPGTGTLIGIGVGVLALLGGGYWLVTKKG